MSTGTNATIKQEAYRMPAEWEPHDATWLAWPHFQEHWPGRFEPIPKKYVEIVRVLTSSELVRMCVNDEAMERDARHRLDVGGVPLKRVEFFRIPTNASWSRDHGPIFVYDNQQLTILDWRFNAWGEQWPFDRDDAVPPAVAAALKMPVVAISMVLEGGAIDVNGAGTLLTTESCLLNKNRNPDRSREEIEAALRQYLGATNILWLKAGITGDDTAGHIDDLARFVNPTTVVCGVTNNIQDVDYAVLQQNFADLQAMRDQSGQVLNVVPLPMPGPVISDGQRLPASYANFYIANTVVLLPTFRCPEDDQALAILERLFPTRRIVGIDCVDLVWGLGTIHCSTQQQPAAHS